MLDGMGWVGKGEFKRFLEGELVNLWAARPGIESGGRKGSKLRGLCEVQDRAKALTARNSIVVRHWLNCAKVAPIFFLLPWNFHMIKMGLVAALLLM